MKVIIKRAILVVIYTVVFLSRSLHPLAPLQSPKLNQASHTVHSQAGLPLLVVHSPKLETKVLIPVVLGEGGLLQ